MSEHLLRTLSELLPNAQIDLVSVRSWHSLTFSGLQLSFKVALPGDNQSMIADEFARELSEQNFDLPGRLVADIGVTGKIAEENHTRLTIDALLVDD